MQGLTIASLKKHPALVPLFFLVGLGMLGSVVYGTRCLLKSPDVVLNRSGDREPQEKYRNKVYKLYLAEMKPEDHVCKAPVYKD